jgi:DNA helicase-2/ATP-dependent DNA helicase PcrA
MPPVYRSPGGGDLGTSDLNQTQAGDPPPGNDKLAWTATNPNNKLMFSDELNPQQLAAVHQTEGPVLVVAGAGSGKTRAITYRIVYLIRGKQVPPESILAITFTNKAAKEMLDRVYKKLGACETYPWVSTFHSFCLKLLRKHIHDLGYSNEFVIYDSQDQLSLV